MSTPPTPRNLQTYSRSDAFIETLRNFGIIQQGHFEYKGKAMDGTRLHGEYFINYRLLTTTQEIQLADFYRHALQEWFGNMQDTIIVGVAMGSLMLPKVIQLCMFEETKIEYAYTEKRNGILGLYGEQAAKCKGKRLIIIEDVCNNGTSTRELINEINTKKDDMGIEGYSIVYGIHRGHMFFEEPKGEFYAMGMIYSPAFHKDECPACEKGLELKEYKK
jgi:orotate phosphoribosyltransferase